MLEPNALPTAVLSPGPLLSCNQEDIALVDMGLSTHAEVIFQVTAGVKANSTQAKKIQNVDMPGLT